MSETNDKDRLSAEPTTSAGDSHEKPIYFTYSATLRIFGNIPDFGAITQRLGVVPTAKHRKGERGWGPDLPPYEHDMWSFMAPVKKSEHLHLHIDSLWSTFRDRKEYLLELKRNLTVDVFLGYQTNCDHAGVEVPYQSLEMFRELQIPFGISIIVL